MNKGENQGSGNPDLNLVEGFTVKEVATYLDETPNVIRNWFKELRKYVPHEKSSNGYNIYKQEGIERFKEIQSLHREQNWSMKQIEYYFATGGESFRPEPEKTSGELLAEELRALRQEISALREDNKSIKKQLDHQDMRMDNQDNFHKTLIQRIEQVNIDRDKQLETIRQLATPAESNNADNQDTIQDKKQSDKKSFWSRLFGAQ
ncbi:MerR family transcriptional regulator [Halobacillus litoralis]|uniref:MerR family transcriptional regulator n=1 Tax=Halobacillus litoralis TaxID=45668 RepID=A0A845DWJ7_9BACI|nr:MULTISPECIES: MerR family transcriptional regulator [Halobacillus]MYL22041.1 MerR family transcriptional regulator [Halobacillus litoralis]MYL31966.1 MerR family transcriptional regulator [Halobacillus halophilus]MYL39968.1 MerR family transcriptional regulator [Halobacillus litoralis]